jgi:hypothetical protein
MKHYMKLAALSILIALAASACERMAKQVLVQPATNVRMK